MNRYRHEMEVVVRTTDVDGHLTTSRQSLFLLADRLNDYLGEDKLTELDLENLVTKYRKTGSFDDEGLIALYAFFAESTPEDCSARGKVFVTSIVDLQGRPLIDVAVGLLMSATPDRAATGRSYPILESVFG